MARPVSMPGMIGRPPTPFRPEILGRSGGQVGAPPAQTTVRYVRKSGSDANGGTSTSDAWLTINKALTTASPGTVVYVGAGVYRETVTVTITPTAALPVSLVGDVDGAWTGDAGEVQWTAYTTDNKTAPSASAVLALSGKSYLSFRNIVFVGGSGNIVSGAVTSQNVTFTDCSFQAGGTLASALLNVNCAYGIPLNWLLDRCMFMNANANAITVTLITGVGPDYDVNFVVQNSVFIGNANRINPAGSGSAAGKGGGVRIRNCVSLPNGTMMFTSTNTSTTIPCSVYNSMMISGSSAALNATTAGQIVEDNNVIASSAPRTNVTAGQRSISDGSYAPLVHFGQERVWGGVLRPIGEPTAGSPLLGFGASDTSAGLLDARSGPRPSVASQFDVGAFQRGGNFGKEITTVHSGSNAISVTGDGFQDFDVAVDAGARTVTVWVNYDSSYVGTPPELQVLANGELDVSTTIDQANPGNANVWQQLTMIVNPTAAGILTVRLVSRDTSGASKVAFDTFAVA